MSANVTHLKLQNFKAIGDPLELELQTPLTVLVGANGCGKSSVLQGASLLGRTASRLSEGGPSNASQVASAVFGKNAQAQELLGPAKGPRDEPPITGRYASEFIKTFGLSARSGESDFEVIPEVELNRPEAPPELVCQLREPGLTTNLMRNDGGAMPPALRSFTSQYLRPEFNLLAAPSRASTGAPVLEESGRGLAVLLSWLATNQRREVDEIERQLRSVVPSFEELRIRPVALWEVEELPMSIASSTGSFPLPRQVAGHQLDLRFSGVDRWVPAHHVSEGTLLALALLTALRAPNPARLILIDDLDRGLHPAAQAALVSAIRLVVEKVQGVQIIATTHSPYILDRFDDAEVRVMNRAGTRVVARRFSDHADWGRFRSTMRLGEFWASVGDEWVLG